MTQDLSVNSLPRELRRRVLSAALDARAAGGAVPEPEPISPALAVARARDRMDFLLAGLTPEQWQLPVLRRLSVQGLVGHLIGVEENLQRVLSGSGEDLAEADHVAVTEEAAQRQAGRDPQMTRREWVRAVSATLDTLERGDDRWAGRLLGLHGMRLPLTDLLTVRAFEIWTHENDIRSVTGDEPSVPDPSTLALMTRLSMQLLPHGIARVGGVGHPAVVRVVLTGAGGGTWRLALSDTGESEAAASETTRIVADAVDFCRLVAARLTGDDVGAYVSGDGSLARRVLAGAAALALD